MRKEDKLLFPRILLIAILAFFLNILNFTLRIKSSGPALTGFSIINSVGEMYSSLPTSSKAVLWIQWAVLIMLLLYAVFRDKGVKEDKKELKTIQLNPHSKASETDLDVLYKLLKEKDSLRMSTISKLFNIDKDLAMEWGKTLEEGKLAIIDYPRFSGPIIKIRK